MTAIALDALEGRSPLGFLAALGTMRLLDDAGHTTRLSWSAMTQTAVLHSDTLSSVDEIVAVLRDVAATLVDGVLVPGGPPGLPPPGAAPDKLRVPPEDLTTLIAELERVGDAAVVQVWVSALVTDLAVDRSGRSEHILFGAFSGKQSMSTMLSKPLELIQARPELLHEALAGWRRVDGVSGEYLDHRVLFDAADSPTGESRERGVPGATWLALMSYPLVRTTSPDGKRAMSTGWYTAGRRLALRWPLWREPWELATIRAVWESKLLTDAARDQGRSGSTHAGTTPTETARAADRSAQLRARLDAMGVFAVMRAERRQVPGRKFDGVLTPVH